MLFRSLFFDLHADGLKIETHLLEDIDGHALAELDQTEKDMFRADIIVVEAIGLLAGEGQNLLGARGEVVQRNPSVNQTG